MREIFHSLIIPTRNRQEYVIDAVGYYLDNITLPCEVIVSDNSTDSSLIFKKLEKYRLDNRLIIIKSENKIISMRDNWERAINASSGNYVTVIGDDDILDPKLIDFLKLAEKGVSNFHKFETFNWRSIKFSWKGVNIDGRRNSAAIPIDDDKLRVLDSKEFLKSILEWKSPTRSNGSGASIYHGVWKRSLINKIKKKNNGKIFNFETVDYDSGYNALLLTDNFLYTGRPFSIMGSAPKSNSSTVLNYDLKRESMEIWKKECGVIDGFEENVTPPWSLALIIYYLNKKWMEDNDFFVNVNLRNVLNGIKQELEMIEPKNFSHFRNDLLLFLEKTEFSDLLSDFNPKAREEHVVGWNGYLNGSIIFDPSNFADRVRDFAEVAFEMVCPWQRVGTNYAIKNQIS
jgi:hypothetical protein